MRTNEEYFILLIERHSLNWLHFFYLKRKKNFFYFMKRIFLPFVRIFVVVLSRIRTFSFSIFFAVVTPAPAPGATGVVIVVIIIVMSMLLATAPVSAPVRGALLMLLVFARSVAVTVPAVGNNLRPGNRKDGFVKLGGSFTITFLLFFRSY